MYITKQHAHAEFTFVFLKKSIYTVKRMKRKPTGWEKIFVNHLANTADSI